MIPLWTSDEIAAATGGGREAARPEEEKPVEPAQETPAVASEEAKPSDWEYVPMSKWDDDLRDG